MRNKAITSEFTAHDALVCCGENSKKFYYLMKIWKKKIWKRYIASDCATLPLAVKQ